MKNVKKNNTSRNVETGYVSSAHRARILLQFSEKIVKLPTPKEFLSLLLEDLSNSYPFDLLFFSDISDPPEIAVQSTDITLDSRDIHTLLNHVFEQKKDSNLPFILFTDTDNEVQTEFNKHGVKTLLILKTNTILFPEYYLGFISCNKVYKPCEEEIHFFKILTNFANLSISKYELQMLFDASYNELQENIERIQRENEQRRELLRKVREQTQELQHKNVEMEEFVYSISHDLKAPIISIQGFVTALNEDFLEELPDEAQFYMSRITKNTSQIESMIREILEYSRIGRITQEKEELSLNEIINDSLDLFSSYIQDRKIEIINKQNYPMIYAEKNRMLQLFSNLIGNSIKYMGDGPKPYIELGSKGINSNYVTVYVKDNGMGIPESFMDKIFIIFSRAPDVKRDEIEGSGIGLAHCKKIVETHGGTIWVESKENQGTTMFFTLPLAEEEFED